MKFRMRSSSPLTMIASEAGNRQAATKLSRADQIETKTDVTYRSSSPRAKVSDWFNSFRGQYTSAYAMYGVVSPTHSGCPGRRNRRSRQAWLCRLQRSQDSLCECWERSSHRHDPWISRFLVHLARPDGGSVG